MTDPQPWETEYFQCECHSSEHTLSFVWDDEDNSIYTEVYLSQYRNIVRRNWVAVKYVFGYRCRYGHWDCFELRPKDALRLEHLLNKLKQ